MKTYNDYTCILNNIVKCYHIKIKSNPVILGYTNSIVLKAMGVKNYKEVKTLKYDYILALGSMAYTIRKHSDKRGKVMNTMYDIVFKQSTSIKNSNELFNYLLKKLNLYREV